MNISETNVNEQIEYIYTFFKPEIEQKGLQIFMHTALPAVEAVIKTDREKVYAILTNLVKNAIKFTNKGSIEFGYEKKGKYLEFFVKDTGVGITDFQRNVIFERFRQGSELLTRNYEGAGLGLSISKAYAEMLGGGIWVESNSNNIPGGNGSIFYFTIPYLPESERNIVSENSIQADNKIDHVNNLKVLIVEDDEISALLLEMNLKQFCSKILKVGTGDDAVQTCRNNPNLDLVMMDIKLQEMDGYEATRQIRKFNNRIIIFAQTAFALKGDSEKALESGCNEYISKPINRAKLEGLINKHFNK
jgi:hypothetical protein